VTQKWPDKSTATAARLLSGAQGTFAVRRSARAVLMNFVKPRLVFLVYLGGAFAFVTASITQIQEAGLGKSTCFAFITLGTY
jgi:FHS family L-fucose permease-like MFS transporter